MISLANGPKKQESCLLVEVRAFGHQSFLGRPWKDVCAMIAMLLTLMPFTDESSVGAEKRVNILCRCQGISHENAMSWIAKQRGVQAYFF